MFHDWTPQQLAILSHYDYVLQVTQRMSQKWKIPGLNEEDFVSAVNEAFTNYVLSQRDSEPTFVKAYITSLVKNKIYDVLRAERCRPRMSLEELRTEDYDFPFVDEGSDEGLRSVDASDTVRFLEGRLDNKGMILARKFSESYSLREIARELSVSERVVQKGLKRIRERGRFYADK